MKAFLHELLAARPVNWKANMLLFPKGVADPYTLRRDMKRAGIPAIDKLGRPVGIHTFRRTFISQLQKAGVHPRVIMQLARHKSLRLTDSTYTDTTLLPLAAGMEMLAPLAAQNEEQISPRSSPRFSGQNGVFVSNAVQVEKSETNESASQVVERESGCLALAHDVQPCPNSLLVPGGSNPSKWLRKRMTLSRGLAPLPCFSSKYCRYR